MLGRYAFSIVVGTAITFSLLFVMHLLIGHAEDAISKERTRHQLDFGSGCTDGVYQHPDDDRGHFRQNRARSLHSAAP